MALYGTYSELGSSSNLSGSGTYTARDIFIYDTTKDSDGGAWRKRTQHTSWYNETLSTTTRGSRREFPAVAIIVVQTDKVVIYDGDDPDFPLWMTFNVTTASGSAFNMISGGSDTIEPADAYMLNGVLAVALKGSGSDVTAGGVPVINFISDTCINYRTAGSGFTGSPYLGTIEQRNDALGNSPDINERGILGGNCVDLAMAVLSNAPIDAATGLPVPTIAVGTQDGVSVIRDDGTVVDLTNSQSGYGANDFVDLTSSGEILLSFENPTDSRNARRLWIADLPTSDTVITTSVIAIGGFAKEFYKDKNTSYGGNALNYHTYDAVGTTAGELYSTMHDLKLTDDNLYLGTNKDLTIINRDRGSLGGKDGMRCSIKSTGNSGWMPGENVVAALVDSDETDQTDSQSVDFTSGSDVSSDPAYGGTTGGSTSSVSTTSITLTAPAGGTMYYSTGFTPVAGKKYIAEITISNYSGSGSVGLSTAGGWSISMRRSSNGSVGPEVITSNGSAMPVFINSGLTATVTLTIYELAEDDFSVNNLGFAVHGTVAKTPIQTGSEIMRYGNWSTSNYLRQPHQNRLDFGTGSFYMMTWFKISSFSDHETLISREDREFDISILSGGEIRIYLRENSSTVNSVTIAASNYTLNDWNHIAVVGYSGTNIHIYVNGIRVSYGSAIVYNITGSNSEELFIGVRKEGGSIAHPAQRTELALVKIGNSRPSGAQIAKIYYDEKLLIQENAKCTLYGSSDSVTALAYDEVKDQLHVGTSSGRSVFQGLQRINNTTDAISTVISAHDGLIVEQ